MLSACLISLALAACGDDGYDDPSLANVSESVPRADRGNPPSKSMARTLIDAANVVEPTVATEPTSTSTSAEDSVSSEPPLTLASTTTSTTNVGASGPSPATTSASNWVDTLVDDMKLFHDGPTAVLESLPGWGSGASWPEATPRPSGWQYAIPWTHTMEDTSHVNGNGYPWRVPGPYTGNQAPNTRVQQRDIQMWWLLSNGQWVLGTHNPRPGKVMYPLHWAEGTEKSGTDIWRDETGNGGGASMRSIGLDAYAKHLWHAWASPHLIPANAIGAATAYFSRLILDNPGGPDDRRQARILSAGAGDWYKDQATLTSPKVQGQNVYYMGFGRLKYVTNEWQMFGWTSLSEAQIRANPPPFIGLPK